MSISSAQEDLLTGVYELVKGSGVLRTPLGRRFFRSAYFMYKQYIEDNLQDLVRSRPALVRGGNVLDIGANIGYTSSILARAADPGSTVYAFEPEAFNYGILQDIARRAEVKGKIVAQQCAVGAQNGTVEIWLNDRHHADHRVITPHFRSENPGLNSFTVPLISIDRFLEADPQPVCFIKIDVQGYELAVCEGMKDTLKKNFDVSIVLEYSPCGMRALGFDSSDLIGFLVDLGFAIYVVGSKGKLLRGMPPAINESGYVDLLFSRRRISCVGEV